MNQRPQNTPDGVLRSWAHNYGSAYVEVKRYTEESPELAETLGHSKVAKAEVVHAVRQEMAQKLSDVVFRRTDLGTGGHPGEDALAACAQLMARELEWDQRRLGQELAEVNACFPEFSRRHTKMGT
jgi:glycerol-3-phosphate dehydrogenase